MTWASGALAASGKDPTSGKRETAGSRGGRPRYGLAEPASPRPDRRERPWRATVRRIRVDLDGSTPAGASAAAAVVAAHIDMTRAIAVEFTRPATPSLSSGAMPVS
jgi:hypothetical protein